jgi:hypothetical protein
MSEFQWDTFLTTEFHHIHDSKAELVPDALQARNYVQASNNIAAMAEMDMRSQLRRE